jgi:ABC-type glycerol-3-phosphate transport system substrate-binding protein
MNQSSSGMFIKLFVVICGILGVLGIAVFAMSQFGSKVDESLTGQIIVWGTLPAKDLDQYFTDYSQINKTFTVEYREIKEVDFIQRFIKSLADDTAPDLILASENVIIPLRQFLQNYDNTQISEAVYKTTFVRASHKLFAENGVVAIPYAVDPLVMYVNTDIMQNANFQRPPTNWSDIPSS